MSHLFRRRRAHRTTTKTASHNKLYRAVVQQYSAACPRRPTPLARPFWSPSPGRGPPLAAGTLSARTHTRSAETAGGCPGEARRSNCADHTKPIRHEQRRNSPDHTSAGHTTNYHGELLSTPRPPRHAISCHWCRPPHAVGREKTAHIV